MPDVFPYVAAILSLLGAAGAAWTAWRTQRAVGELQSKFKDIAASPDVNDPLSSEEGAEMDAGADQEDR